MSQSQKPVQGPPVKASPRDAPAPGSDVLCGIGVSPGIVVGTVTQVRHGAIEVPEEGGDPARERQQFDAALDRARAELDALHARLRTEADGGDASIFAVHEAWLADPDLVEPARRFIAEGRSAAFAWRLAVATCADGLSQADDEILAARASDVLDLGRRVLRLLTGAALDTALTGSDLIVIAEDLTPSDVATLDRSRVLGFCTVTGGATSHVAILARSLGLPAMAGADPRVLTVAAGTSVILDGGRGTLHASPSEAEIAAIRQRQAREVERRRAELEHALLPASTRDGHRVRVAANTGPADETRRALAFGAEGVGLLRSEFLFLGRQSSPTEQEQDEVYETIARALGPERPLIIRMLDAGGDKALPYLPTVPEDNPFLGERGVRVMLRRPDVMGSQLRAILRASRVGRVHLLVPMVSTLDEWRAVKRAYERERRQLGVAPVPVGIMVEVPATAIMAEQFAREVDFFSIGTNDLTQFTLAMDRDHPRLATQVDALNPAVLRLVSMTIDAAHRHGKWVSVCGVVAADAQAVPILVGLGVDELSVSAADVPAVKARIRTLERTSCEALARRALAASSAADVRRMSPAD